MSKSGKIIIALNSFSAAAFSFLAIVDPSFNLTCAALALCSSAIGSMFAQLTIARLEERGRA